MDKNQQDLLQLLTQMGKGGGNKMQMLAQLMAQQNQEAVPQEEAASDEAIDKLVSQLKQQGQLVKKLRDTNKKQRQRIKMLIENLNYRIEVNDALAAATGSCPDCWGEDEHCPNCGGKGAPGQLPIDEEAFMIFIQPILKKHMKNRHEDPYPRYKQNNIHSSHN